MPREAAESRDEMVDRIYNLLTAALTGIAARARTLALFAAARLKNPADYDQYMIAALIRDLIGERVA